MEFFSFANGPVRQAPPVENRSQDTSHGWAVELCPTLVLSVKKDLVHVLLDQDHDGTIYEVGEDLEVVAFSKGNVPHRHEAVLIDDGGTVVGGNPALKIAVRYPTTRHREHFDLVREILHTHRAFNVPETYHAHDGPEDRNRGLPDVMVFGLARERRGEQRSEQQLVGATASSDSATENWTSFSF